MNENYFLNSYRYLQNVSEVVITLTENKFVSFHRMNFISNSFSLGKRLFIVPHTTLKCSSLEPNSMEDVGVRFSSQISRISMKIMKRWVQTFNWFCTKHFTRLTSASHHKVTLRAYFLPLRLQQILNKKNIFKY